jgi:hypothetical protein
MGHLPQIRPAKISKSKERRGHGRHLRLQRPPRGIAEDNADGSWDIHTSDGRYLSQIQDNGDGSFDVSGADRGDWGSRDDE